MLFFLLYKCRFQHICCFASTTSLQMQKDETENAENVFCSFSSAKCCMKWLIANIEKKTRYVCRSSYWNKNRKPKVWKMCIAKISCLFRFHRKIFCIFFYLWSAKLSDLFWSIWLYAWLSFLIILFLLGKMQGERDEQTWYFWYFRCFCCFSVIEVF